jgi:hypothetical protein
VLISHNLYDNNSYLCRVDSGEADPNGTVITLNKDAATGGVAAVVELKDKFGNRRVRTKKDKVTVEAKSTKV